MVSSRGKIGQIGLTALFRALKLQCAYHISRGVVNVDIMKYRAQRRLTYDTW